jgi:hypothetical protein
VAGANAKACCEAAAIRKKRAALNFMVVIVVVKYCGSSGLVMLNAELILFDYRSDF